ncbi:MAG: TldD/PmbA family protein, partial [Candidatus Kariarchaeaceae archaeon]
MATQHYESSLSELHQLAEKAIKLGEELGASQVEVVASNGSKKALEIKTSSITGLQQQSTNQFKIRAYVGKQVGIGTTTSLSMKSVEEAVHDALKLAKLTPEDPTFESLAQPMERPVADVKKTFDPMLATYDPEMFIGYANDVIAGVSEGHEKGRANGNLNVTTTERVIANSLGVEAGTLSTSFFGFVGANIVMDPTNVGSAFELTSARVLEDLKEGHEIGTTAVNRAEKLLDAKGAPTGTFDIIVDARAAYQSFQSLIGGGVSGYSVMTKTSYFADKIGEQVAIAGLNVVDDPHIAGAMGARSIDAEGVPTTRVNLVENGVLQSFVTDNYTSRVLGLDNTGNATTMGKLPRPSVSNMRISPGEDSRDAMIEDMKEGIYMESAVGGMFNRGSVNISNKIDRGFYVKDGEIQYP